MSKCTANKKSCCGYSGGECISIENCMYQERFTKNSKPKKKDTKK